MNIPQVYRQNIASSLVGTPGVNPAGREVGEAVAKGGEEIAAPVWQIAEEAQAKRDTGEYNQAMIQHDTNMVDALENIKVKYADNPEAAGPAMAGVIKDSLQSVTAAASNPRTKLMIGAGDRTSEWWNLRAAYQWQSAQEYNNLVKGSVKIMADTAKTMEGIGSNAVMSAQDMVNAMTPAMVTTAHQINLLKASKFPEAADEFELKAKYSAAKSMLDGAMETQPWKAGQLIANPEFAKLLPPDEVLKYQKDSEAATKAFPEKMMTRAVQSDMVDRSQMITDAITGKIGYAAIDAASKKNLLGMHPETYTYLKQLSTNSFPEAAAADRDRLRAGFADDARTLGLKVNNDPAKLADVKNGKAVMHKSIEDIYKFQDEIISAYGRGIIDKNECTTYMNQLAHPLTFKTLQKHDPTFWDTLKQKWANTQAGESLFTGKDVPMPFDPKRVDTFQSAARVIEEHLTRTGQQEDFNVKAKYYDDYFKAADALRPGTMKPGTNEPFTHADLAHAVVGEGKGDFMQTKLGWRPIIDHDKKTGAPIVQTTKEDDEAIAAAQVLMGLSERAK